MLWPDSTIPRSLLLASLMTVGAVVAAPAPVASPTPAASPAPTVPVTQLPAIQPVSEKIDIPVPVGETVKGIKIPQYDEQGKLTMSLAAETARKIDDHQVEFGTLKVQFSDNAEKEIMLEIPHSILNLDTKILLADSETLIHREDFEIVGQGAEFDTVARQGTFKGHVRASFLNGTPIQQP